jgi:amidase
MTELHELDALAMAQAIINGEVSPTELVEHHLDRIAAYGDRLGAFVTVTADEARQAAKIAEEQHAEGIAAASPLFGVPTAIKDLTPTAGVRTTFGSRAFADWVPDVDANAVTLIRRAGMISLGKTNTPEWGLSAYSDNGVTAGVRTPWDLTRSAGGSSGGAAAAVAAGLIPIAHGSDGGGSLRIPASACGVFGFKPTRGRVSSGPLGVDVTGLGVQGPIAWTVADAAAMLDALATPMPGDPYWAPPLEKGDTFLAAARTDPGQLRIARFSDAGFPVDPDVHAAYQDTAALLEDLGHDVEEIGYPFGDELVDHFNVLWAAQALGMPVPPAGEPLLQPMTRWWRERARRQTGEQVYNALVGMQLGARRALERLAPFDALLCPTLALPPQPIDYFRSPDDQAEEAQRQHAFTPFTAGFNITGQPAASLPLGVSATGLPLGVMLAGRPAGDAALLSLCAQVEAARPWRDRRPTL